MRDVGCRLKNSQIINLKIPQSTLWVAGMTHFGKNSLLRNSLKTHKKCINMNNLANSNHRNYDKCFGEPLKQLKKFKKFTLHVKLGFSCFIENMGSVVPTTSRKRQRPSNEKPVTELNT